MSSIFRWVGVAGCLMALAFVMTTEAADTPLPGSPARREGKQGAFNCPTCGRHLARGQSFLMRGDDFCSELCGYLNIYPDEGMFYRGGVLEPTGESFWAGEHQALKAVRPKAAPEKPDRRIHADVLRAKISNLDYRATKLPQDYPIPYPDPVIPQVVMQGHPAPLKALYERETVRKAAPTTEPPEARFSQRLAYRNEHESHVPMWRPARASDGGIGLYYPQYPWNSTGELFAPPKSFKLGPLAGDLSALSEGVALRMEREYLYLKNQRDDLYCDLRVPVFGVRHGTGQDVYQGPSIDPKVIEAGGSHGEQGWTPAPTPAESIFYWPMTLDPFSVGNLGGAIYYSGKKPIYCLAMQGWLIRPGRQEPAIKFYEGPYISHESLAYYHGPAERYPGFDRNRIAVMAWWAPPKLREYLIYDGNGKLIRTFTTNSDRVHMCWGDHGNTIIGDSSYDAGWPYPGTMTVLFPDTGALRPIGFHDNNYVGSKNSEHPHPSVSPDGTKLLFKASHMEQLDGLEVMVICPPRAPVAEAVAGRLRWHVPEVNCEIGQYRVFYSPESGRGYRFVAEITDPRSVTDKLAIRDQPYWLEWVIPPDMKGTFLVCSVEGSGLMSPPSNEVAFQVSGPRRLFIPVEGLIGERRSAYITPDGEAASWAVVRQIRVETRPGETQPGNPTLTGRLPEERTYTVYARTRGHGALKLTGLGQIKVDEDEYRWILLGTCEGGAFQRRLELAEGVRLDQLCFTSDLEFVPAGRGPLALTPSAPTALRADRQNGTVSLAWEAPPERFVKEYHVYAVTGEEEKVSPHWRLCTVKTCSATDWNLPDKPVQYYVTAVGWDMQESLPCGPLVLPATGAAIFHTDSEK